MESKFEVELFEENHSFTKYTLEKYEEFVREFNEDKKRQLRNVLSLSTITALGLSNGPVVNSIIDTIVHSLKLFWIPPTVYFGRYNINLAILNGEDFQIDLEILKSRKDELKEKQINFQLTTNGKNLDTTKESILSCLYWARQIERKYDIKFNKDFLIVTEEDSYNKTPSFYKDLETLGIKVLAVPREYETKRKSKFKTRALHYVTELMKDSGFDLKSIWSYKLDDDTVIGEDTLLGISSFVANSEDTNKIMGMGLILYDRGWDKANRLNIEESIRTHTLFSVLGEMKLLGYAFSGYNGSHFIVREDVETEIGWDFGPTRAEDLMFAKILGERYGKNTIGILPGFAHEQPPYTIKDFLKQRRRWIKGNFDALRSDLIGLRSKLEILYGLVTWYSGFPAILAMFATFLHPTGGLFGWFGFSTGLSWASLYNLYRYGYKINGKYVDEELKGDGKFKKIGKIFVGSFLESIAPWYGLFTRNNAFEVIDKNI